MVQAARIQRGTHCFWASEAMEELISLALTDAPRRASGTAKLPVNVPYMHVQNVMMR